MKNFQAIFLAAFFAIILGVGALYNYGTDEYVTFTVEDKERVVKSNGETTTSAYLIFTEAETFKNSDTIFYWKWNSSDIYGSLKRGSTYRARVYGFRFGLLSMYRNVISVELVGKA